MGTIRINGNNFSGDSICITNGNVVVNGKTVMSEIKVSTLHIKVEGDIKSLKCDGSVEVNGNVLGNVDCGGSFTGNDVGGDVDCGGSFTGGNVSGDIDAGGSVRIKK